MRSIAPSQSYLYGIEINAYQSSRKRVAVSQSYLYGIEIRDTQSVEGNDRTVSIVPLWNWNSLSITLLVAKIDGLNRTFMELKSALVDDKREGRAVSIVPLWNWNASTTAAAVSSSWSQSYLYGIEIGSIAEVIKVIISLNRTFMELKFGSIQHVNSRNLSQSYLYGIEIKFNSNEQRHYC